MSSPNEKQIVSIRTHMMLHGAQHRFPLEDCCAIVSISATESYWREQIARDIEGLDSNLGVHDGDETLDRDEVLQAIRGK